MKPLNIYIVEDEPLIVATIETALRKHKYNAIGDADNFMKALTDIEKLKPDLTLIDIQLSGDKDGVDLAMALEKQNLPYLYLSSQTDPHTIARVKDTNPLGYIVKPFTENGLRTNIELAWHNHLDVQSHFLNVRHEGRMHRINEKNILYLKAYDNYCYVVTTNTSYLVPHTLKHISEQLHGKEFIKCHRSYVVNIKYVKSVAKHELFLVNTSIPLSASQKSLITNRLNDLI